MASLEEYLKQLSHNHLPISPEKKDCSNGCPHGCTDGFIYYTDDKGYNMAKECQCRKDRVLNNRLRFANIPDAFKDMTLSNFKSSVYRLPKSKELITLVSKFIQAYFGNLELERANGKGLYIYSNTKGSGKTRFAASVANEMITKYGIRVKFATSIGIGNEIRSTYDKENRSFTESSLMDALYTAEMLIIDDFGAEKITDFVNDKFYSIVNERYSNRKVTIYTSNYDIHELPYDERIKSRVKERVYSLQFPEECIRDYISDQDNAAMLKRVTG